jgi:hypothetical protein
VVAVLGVGLVWAFVSGGRGGDVAADELVLVDGCSVFAGE